MQIAMRVAAPLCAARLITAATSTTALHAARIASGLSTSTSVRSVGGDDKAATAKQCRVASGEEVAKGTSIDVHPNDSAADEEVDYSQLSPDHPLYALAGKDDSFDSMMQKLAGSIQVHKVTAPAAVSEVAGADPDARDERRADEEQLRGLFTSVNAHRGPGGGGEAAVAAAVAAAAASWNVDEGLLSALVAHARLPVSFVEVKIGKTQTVLRALCEGEEDPNAV